MGAFSFCSINLDKRSLKRRLFTRTYTFTASATSAANHSDMLSNVECLQTYSVPQTFVHTTLLNERVKDLTDQSAPQPSSSLNT